GVGRAEALALAQVGAGLVLNDLPGDAVHEVAKQAVSFGAKVTVVTGDVGEWATGEALLRAALTSCGRLDIPANNAGVLRDRTIFSMTADEWDMVIRVHLRGHFVITRLVTAHWR